jgi:hypothetical protein
MENVSCLSVPSGFPGIHIFIATCVNFPSVLWFLGVYNFQISYPWKSLSKPSDGLLEMPTCPRQRIYQFVS